MIWAMRNEINSVAAWGDSILKGAVTGYSDNFFDVLKGEDSLSLAAQKLGFSLDNFSVFGSTLAKTQKRLNRVLYGGRTFDLGIIESGGNDCDYDWQAVCERPDLPHQMRTPLPDFLRLLGETVDTLRAHKITPLLVTLPPLVADKWFAHITRALDSEKILSFLGGDKFKPYSTHELYSASLLHFAQQNEVQLIDLRKTMLEAPNQRSLMCDDGIHPNKSGYAYLGEAWVRELPKVCKEF